MTRNRVRQNPGMDLLTYFSQSEHATCPQRVLYHRKVGFIRADLLDYRKLEGFVNQTSPVPLCPCRHSLFSNRALSPEASSGCLNRSKLFAVPSRSLRKACLFTILKPGLFAPGSPQQRLSLLPTTASPGAAGLRLQRGATGAQHGSLPAGWRDAAQPAGCSRDEATGRFLLPACPHLFEAQRLQ